MFINGEIVSFMFEKKIRKACKKFLHFVSAKINSAKSPLDIESAKINSALIYSALINSLKVLNVPMVTETLPVTKYGKVTQRHLLGDIDCLSLVYFTVICICSTYVNAP